GGMTLFGGLPRVAVALIVIYFLGNRSVVDQVLTVAGFTTGAILGVFILGSLRHPVRSRAALWGLVVGFLTVFVVWLPTALADRPIPGWAKDSFLPPQWGGLALAWPCFALVGART